MIMIIKKNYNNINTNNEIVTTKIKRFIEAHVSHVL